MLKGVHVINSKLLLKMLILISFDQQHINRICILWYHCAILSTNKEILIIFVCLVY